MTASRAKKMPTKIMMRPAARFLPTTPRPAMMPLKKGGLFRQQAAPWQHKGKSTVSVYIYKLHHYYETQCHCPKTQRLVHDKGVSEDLVQSNDHRRHISGQNTPIQFIKLLSLFISHLMHAFLHKHVMKPLDQKIAI